MKGINSTNNYNIININKYRYNNKNCNNNICFKKNVVLLNTMMHRIIQLRTAIMLVMTQVI